MSVAYDTIVTDGATRARGQRLLDTKPTAQDFYEQMLALHPDRLNRGPLWYGALGLLGA